MTTSPVAPGLPLLMPQSTRGPGEKEMVPLVLGSVLVQENTRQPWQDPTPLCPCSAVSPALCPPGEASLAFGRRGPAGARAPQTNLAPANAKPGGSSRLQRRAFRSRTPTLRSPCNAPPWDSRLLRL